MNRLPLTPIFLALVVLVAGVYFALGQGKTTPAAPRPAGWPLSVNGTLACQGNAVTVTAADGAVYALNGNAVNRAAANGWHLARDVQTGDVGPLIQQGLALCP